MKLIELFKSNGGNKKMETKSRYEVIADLEQKKRELILERDSFNDNLKEQEKSLKELKRQVEDKSEEIEDFKQSMERNKTTLNELIKSTDNSLNRFVELQTTK